MQLITKEIEKKFEKYPLYSQDGKGMDAQVLVKYFSPMSSHNWYILEANKLDNGDYEMFGYVSVGSRTMDEYGYVYLSELKNIKMPYGMGIERDLYSRLGTLKEMLESDGRLLEE